MPEANHSGSEFGAALLPSGHVGVESDSHATEIRCTGDLPRLGFLAD